MDLASISKSINVTAVDTTRTDFGTVGAHAGVIVKSLVKSVNLNADLGLPFKRDRRQLVKTAPTDLP
jgi:hypothetical protein